MSDMLLRIRVPTPDDLPQREPSPLTKDEMRALMMGEKTIEQIGYERDAPIRAAEVEWYAKQFEELLKPFHTRELLAKRHRSRDRDVPLPWDNDIENERDPYIKGYDIALRRVLATREHIPNKAEAKRIRQEKARAAQGRRKR